jgi:hypothetical protein
MATFGASAFLERIVVAVAVRRRTRQRAARSNCAAHLDFSAFPGRARALVGTSLNRPVRSFEERMIRIKTVLAATAVAMCVLAACGFPDVTFDDLGVDDANHGSVIGEPRAVGAEALPGPQRPSDAGVLDAAEIDAGCTSCDCDGDGFDELTRAGCEVDGGSNDCDDDDPRVKPTQSFLPEPADPPRFGDWNCDGKTDRLWPEDVDCSKLGLADCATAFGFAGTVACGQTAAWQKCVWSWSKFACVAATLTLEIQSCR